MERVFCNINSIFHTYPNQSREEDDKGSPVAVEGGGDGVDDDGDVAAKVLHDEQEQTDADASNFLRGNFSHHSKQNGKPGFS